MSEFVTDRQQITKRVLAQIMPDYSPDQWMDARKTWWMNIRDTGGLRLTLAGFTAFLAAGIERWDHEVKVDMDHLEKPFFLMLDNRMPCPYYLWSKKNKTILSVYDSRIASVLVLYDYDLVAMLNNFEPLPGKSK